MFSLFTPGSFCPSQRPHPSLGGPHGWQLRAGPWSLCWDPVPVSKLLAHPSQAVLLSCGVFSRKATGCVGAGSGMQTAALAWTGCWELGNKDGSTAPSPRTLRREVKRALRLQRGTANPEQASPGRHACVPSAGHGPWVPLASPWMEGGSSARHGSRPRGSGR